MKTIFGIDFGTTNSALSVFRERKVEIIDIDKYNMNGKTMRSVIYFDEENHESFVGQEAIDKYVANGSFGRFMQSIKTFLPSSFQHTYIYGKKYEIEDLVSIIIKKIKNVGEEYVGEEITDVVIGRPVVFSEEFEIDSRSQRRLEEAAKRAGFKNVIFQYEPIAAALTYEEGLKHGEEKVVFIGDFGGGTSDFTIIKLKGGSSVLNKRKEDVLSIGGVYVAGDALNSQIMWEKITKHFGRYVKYRRFGKDDWLNLPVHIVRTLCQWHMIPQLREKSTRDFIGQLKNIADDRKSVENLENLIADNYGFMLFQTIEKAKCDLSLYDSSNIVFKERSLQIKESITKKEFEEMNQENLSKIGGCIDNVLSNSGLSADNIDVVFITGGTSYVPSIQKLFIDRFGDRKLQRKEAFTSVVHGLGVTASFL